ncbi:MAG: flagellar biosynthetic protein FliQ [Bdellovibrionota bacterium]
METTLLIANALRLVAQLSLPLFLAILAGAVVSGVIRVATQIDDASIGFAGRFTAAVALLYFGSLSLSKPVFDFALRIWGGADFYH